jgi:hypothetical protein
MFPGQAQLGTAGGTARFWGNGTSNRAGTSKRSFCSLPIFVTFPTKNESFQTSHVIGTQLITFGNLLGHPVKLSYKLSLSRDMEWLRKLKGKSFCLGKFESERDSWHAMGRGVSHCRFQ